MSIARKLMLLLAQLMSKSRDCTLRYKRNLYMLGYAHRFARIGTNVRFSPENSSFTYEKIEIGNNVFINKGTDFRGMVTIGNDVMFGPYVYITDGRHEYEQVGKTIQSQGAAQKARIVIEDDCWISARCMIMRGARIGEGCIIGGMSAVTREMPPYTVCIGSPCKPVKYRYDRAQLQEHLHIIGKTDEEADEIIRRRDFLCAQMNPQLMLEKGEK